MTTGGDFISIDSRRFYGLCSRSPTGRYTIAWSDADHSRGIAGSREAGSGRYILLDDQTVVVEDTMQRPNDGKVADSGVFILDDWGFGEGLKGTLRAFDREGRAILARTFAANLFNNGLSADGRFAACQTCHSPGSTDSSVLTIFDLSLTDEAARFAPESGWADFYTFPDEHTVGLGYRELGVFRYSHGGSFIDRAEWQEAKLTKGPPGAALWLVDRMIREADANMSTALAGKLIRAVDRAMAGPTDDRTRALALKCRGICLESQGTFRDALTCYETALGLDPKSGVKQRANRLAKALGAPGLIGDVAGRRPSGARTASKDGQPRATDLRTMADWDSNSAPKRRSYELDFHVAGVSHDGRQEVIRSRIGEIESASLQLVREPSNPYDPNAIRVCLDDGTQLGYVPRGAVSRETDLDQVHLARMLDRGASYWLECWGVPGLATGQETLGLGVRGRAWDPVVTESMLGDAPEGSTPYDGRNS